MKEFLEYLGAPAAGALLGVLLTANVFGITCDGEGLPDSRCDAAGQVIERNIVLMDPWSATAATIAGAILAALVFLVTAAFYSN